LLRACPPVDQSQLRTIDPYALKGSAKPSQGHGKVRQKLFHVMTDISRISLTDDTSLRRNLGSAQMALSCWRDIHTMLLSVIPGSRMSRNSQTRHRSNEQPSFSSAVYLHIISCLPFSAGISLGPAGRFVANNTCGYRVR
jgi:hypothetical protein